MAKDYEYEHTHIELKHGYATFLGKDFKPSDELLNALNKMAELAYNECGGLKVNTGGRQLTIPDVSGWVSVDDVANPMPNIEGLQVMFESGTYMDYDAHPWPHEKVTHWRKKPCR